MSSTTMTFSAALDQVFSQRGWLSRQSPELRRKFLELSRCVSFGAGESIVQSGDEPGGIYGVVSGGVGCEGMSDLAGPTLGHIFRAGAWFGMGPLMAADIEFARMIARLTEEDVSPVATSHQPHSSTIAGSRFYRMQLQPHSDCRPRRVGGVHPRS